MAEILKNVEDNEEREAEISVGRKKIIYRIIFCSNKQGIKCIMYIEYNNFKFCMLEKAKSCENFDKKV